MQLLHDCPRHLVGRLSLDQMLDKERLTFRGCGSDATSDEPRHAVPAICLGQPGTLGLQRVFVPGADRLGKEVRAGRSGVRRLMCHAAQQQAAGMERSGTGHLFSHAEVGQWKGSPYLDFYRKLLHAYRENPALYEGDFHRITTAKPASVYAYRRRTASNQAVVIVNLGNQPQHITLGVNEVAGKFSEVFTGESKDLTAAELDLRPWGYKLFVRSTSGKNE